MNRLTMIQRHKYTQLRFVCLFSNFYLSVLFQDMTIFSPLPNSCPFQMMRVENSHQGKRQFSLFAAAREEIPLEIQVSTFATKLGVMELFRYKQCKLKQCSKAKFRPINLKILEEVVQCILLRLVKHCLKGKSIPKLI